MALLSGRDLGLELCEAFGLNPDTVAKITIVAACEDATRVEIERYVTDNEGKRVSTIIAKYTLSGPDAA